ncbi:DUF2268 domain-containing putative Zn-dependent protease [Arenimonas sp.]|uniref:DUF2268 domain-containing putative Zn-dependent protease n=1 Tax=Arenimonas sp. TaxID=1872635 RepID=UPI0039E6D0DB
MKHLILLAALSPALAFAAQPIDFHYTNTQVLDAPADAGDATGKAWFTRCAEGGEFAMLAPGYAPDPRMTREEREAAEKDFDRAKFEAIAQQAFDRVQQELPQDKLSLCVDFTRPDDAFARDKMRGVMALTAGSGRIIVKLHPGSDWAKLLPYVLAHELHHSYWAKHHFDPNKPFTLGEYLVFEGRADNFAKHAFGEHPAPWIDALSADQYRSTLKTFAPLYGDSSPQVLMGAMFGNPAAGIPQWAGYTVGYRLVAEKIAHDKLTDWPAISALPADNFLPPQSP